MFRGGSPASGIAAITGGSIGTGTTGLATLLGQSFVAVSAPSDVTEDILATVTVPANVLGANGSIRLRCRFAYTNSANNKTLRVRYSGIGGTIYATFTVTTTGCAVVDVIIGNANATNSQTGYNIGYIGTGVLGLSNTTSITSAVDTTASTTLVMTGQKALNTETLTLESYTAEVVH